MIDLSEPVEFNVVQGADLNFGATVANDDGTPVNLTGYTAKLQIRQTHTGSLLAESSTSNGEIVITALIGIVTVTMPGAKTGALAVGDYVSDLFVYGPASVPTLCITRLNPLHVLPRVTV